MSEKLRTIRLYGKLGAKFGRVHRLAVNSTAEAIRALCILIPGFEQYLYDAPGSYSVFIGRENIEADGEHFHRPVGNDEIRIAHIPQGAKNGGLFSLIAGVVLVVVGVFTVNPYLVAIGVGFALGGAMMMLSPVPKGADELDKAANRPSYVFNGSVNTEAQGNPVPLLYGELICGSAVLSGGVYSEDRA